MKCIPEKLQNVNFRRERECESSFRGLWIAVRTKPGIGFLEIGAGFGQGAAFVVVGVHSFAVDLRLTGCWQTIV
jgi:hypothetical protein